MLLPLLLLSLHPAEHLIHLVKGTSTTEYLLERIVTTKEVAEEVMARALGLHSYITSERHLLLSEWKVCAKSKRICLLLLSLLLLSLKLLFLALPFSSLLFLLSKSLLFLFLDPSPCFLSFHRLLVSILLGVDSPSITYWVSHLVAHWLFISKVLSGSHVWGSK